jgi:hypothetical protein
MTSRTVVIKPLRIGSSGHPRTLDPGQLEGTSTALAEEALRVAGFLSNWGIQQLRRRLDTLASAGIEDPTRSPSTGTSRTTVCFGFEILTGDDIIRRIPYQRRASQAGQLFELTLRVIVSRVESSNVISEGAWTQRQISSSRTARPGSLLRDPAH